MSFGSCLAGFARLEIEVTLRQGRIRLDGADFGLAPADEAGCFVGCCAGMELRVFVRDEEPAGPLLWAQLRGKGPLACHSIGFRLTYTAPGQALAGWRVPCKGRLVQNAGLHPLCETPTPEESGFCGLFKNDAEPCVFIGTVLPQKNLHLYSARLSAPDTALIEATTWFTAGQGGLCAAATEKMRVVLGKRPLAAVQAYAAGLPALPPGQPGPPLVGWNSWDYYFSALWFEDIAENVRAIAEDPVLRDNISCVIIDMGWEHREGDWQANYRFPRGMAHAAGYIRSHGLTPGIWTNGCQVDTLSAAALRGGDMLLRDCHGDALTVEGMYLVDPTHPAGEAYLRELYARLYGWGFRLFKVDFVGELTHAHSFHDPQAGPYDAIRRLMAIVREEVGEDSHILGCACPAECGPGCCDSLRIGVDIHNQWGHVRWVLEYLQMGFWLNDRVGRLDPDFLVVRGGDTSKEAETNVFNPFCRGPAAAGTAAARWRRGPVFDRHEAETWARVVTFAGGNVILADRLAMLNEAGRRLVHRHLRPGPAAAVPLDLGAGPVAAFWYLRDGAESSLLVINHGEEARELAFPFARYGLGTPGAVECDRPARLEGGVLNVPLQRHQSALVHWRG